MVSAELHKYNLPGRTVTLNLGRIFQPNQVEIDEEMTVLSRQVGHLLLPIASNRWQMIGLDAALNTELSEDPDSPLSLFAGYEGLPGLRPVDMSRASAHFGVNMEDMGLTTAGPRQEALVQVRHIRAAGELSFTGLSMAGAVLLSQYSGEVADYAGIMNG